MKRVTTTDVAREAGVSQTTVSLVLSGKKDISISEETKARVVETAQRIGYQRLSERAVKKRVKHAPRPPKKLIGLLVPNMLNLFFTNVICYIERYASMQGYQVIVSNIERKIEREEEKLEAFVARGVDGIIIAYTPRNIEYIKNIKRTIPVVIVGESPMGCGIQTIGINGYKCGEMAASYLYEMGHRHLVHFTAPINRISLTRVRRIEGVNAFLQSKNCANGLLVLEDEAENEGEEIYELEMGYRLTRKLIQSGEKFTAIMCPDLCVPGVYSVLKEAGFRVPEDVSIVGIDNVFVCRIINPQLTTVDHHLRERCKLALDTLIEIILSGEPDREGYLVEFSPSLVIRDSAAMIFGNE